MPVVLQGHPAGPLRSSSAAAQGRPRCLPGEKGCCWRDAGRKRSCQGVQEAGEGGTAAGEASAGAGTEVRDTPQGMKELLEQSSEGRGKLEQL